MTSRNARYPFLDPRPEDVCLLNIAQGLSHLCRFGGKGGWLSVAEHSVNVSLHVPDDMAAWGLLHDAAEGLIGFDVPTPIKEYVPGLVAIEAKSMQAMANRYGLDWPEPEEIKRVDQAMAGHEADALGLDLGEKDPGHRLAGGVEIRRLPPKEAKLLFLERAYELGLT